MPFNPYDIPNIRVTSLNPQLPDPNKSLAALMQMHIQQQRMALAAARAAGRGGGKSYEGNPRLGRYVMVPQKDGTKKQVWVTGTTPAERDAAEAKAIDAARQEILAGDKAYQEATAGFENKSKAGMTETLDKFRKEHLPRLAQTMGMSGEEASKYITGGLQRTLDDYSKRIDEAGVGTQIGQGLRQVWRNTVDAIAGIARTSEEQIAAGNANREAAAQDLKENAWQENLERMRAEGRSTFLEQLTNPGRTAAMHGTQLGAMIAPALAGGAVGGLPGAIIGGALGAGLPAAGEAMARVSGDENLTPAQRAEAIGTTGLISGLTSGAIGAIPIGPANLARPALVRAALGRQVAKQGVPEVVASKMLPEATEAQTKAAVDAWARGQAGTVLRPGPYTPNWYQSIGEHAVNAGALGGIFQLGSNAAYNIGTGQSLPLTERLPEAIVGGAALGLPFGLAGRARVAWQKRTPGADPNYRPDLTQTPGTIYDMSMQPEVRPTVEAPPTGPWENPTLPRTVYDEPLQTPAPPAFTPPPTVDRIIPVTVPGPARPTAPAPTPIRPPSTPVPPQSRPLDKPRQLLDIYNDASTNAAISANKHFISTKPKYQDFVDRIEAINEFQPAYITDLFKRAIEKKLLSPGEVEVIAQGVGNNQAKSDAIYRAISEAKVPFKTAEDALFASKPDFNAVEQFILDKAKSSKDAARIVERAFKGNVITPENAGVMRENLLAALKNNEHHKIIKGFDKGVKNVEKAATERALQDAENEPQPSASDGREQVSAAELEEYREALAAQWAAELEAEKNSSPYRTPEEAALAAQWAEELYGTGSTETNGGGGREAPSVGPDGQVRAGETDTGNPASDSTRPANPETTPPTPANSPAPEIASGSAPVERGGNVRPPAQNTGPIEEAPAALVEQGVGGPESPVREPGFEPAAATDAAGGAGAGELEPAQRQRARDARNAKSPDGNDVKFGGRPIPMGSDKGIPSGNAIPLGPREEAPLPDATPEQIHAIERENRADTPVEDRISPTDSDAIVQKKLIRQLQDAKSSGDPADQAALLTALAQTWQTLNGKTPAEELRNVIFSFNEKLEPQVMEALRIAGFDQEAWHGTPFSGHISQLTTDKLGSGEGAQVHGWGLYVALSEQIAKERYQHGLAATRQPGIILTHPEYGKFNLNDAETALPFGKDKFFGFAVEDLSTYGKAFKTILKEELQQAPDFDTAVANIIENFRRDINNDPTMAEKFGRLLNAFTDLQKISGEFNKGQRLRVEIPEDNVMLRERALWKDQPDNVKKLILKAIDKLPDKDGRTLSTLKWALANPETPLQGGGIYQMIGRVLEPTKRFNEQTRAASLFLDKHGIKGIRYKGGIDGECAVIFNGDAIRILERFYDQNGGRGRIDFYSDGTARVLFSNTADASTAIHEFEHLFINRVGQMLRNGEIVSESKRTQLMQDLTRLAKWGGEKEANADVFGWSRETHEKIARGFEAYVREGKAPTPELQGIFSRMKDLLIRLYQRAKELIGADKLPKDVREIFDRQLTGYEEKPLPKPKMEPVKAERAAPVVEKRALIDVSKPFTEETYNAVKDQITPGILRRLTQAGHDEAAILEDIEAENWDTLKGDLEYIKQLDKDMAAQLDKLNEYASQKWNENFDRLTQEDALKPESVPQSEELLRLQDEKTLKDMSKDGPYTTAELQTSVEKAWDKIAYPKKPTSFTENAQDLIRTAFAKEALGEKLTKTERAAYDSAVKAGVQPLKVNREAVQAAVVDAHNRNFTDVTPLQVVTGSRQEAVDKTLARRIWC